MATKEYMSLDFKNVQRFRWPTDILRRSTIDEDQQLTMMDSKVLQKL